MMNLLGRFWLCQGMARIHHKALFWFHLVKTAHCVDPRWLTVLQLYLYMMITLVPCTSPTLLSTAESYAAHTNNTTSFPQVAYDSDRLKLPYFMSSRETAFSICMLKRFVSEIIGQISYKELIFTTYTYAGKFNTIMYTVAWIRSLLLLSEQKKVRLRSFCTITLFRGPSYRYVKLYSLPLILIYQ